MDVNVNTHLKQSEINGLFNEMEQLKNKRKQDLELIQKKEAKIIEHILEHGNVLAYKDDVPHILSVVNTHTRKFDKAKLADDTGRTQTELNVVGIAELVEDNQTSSEELEDYFYEEPNQKLKARKAKKSDMDLLRSSGRI
ncbi:hypothetical protein [Oceanobacillus indicireducens]|uniref:Uncharacterized protein n=1 Tax=Oceanobacillus indicireducens TaxID=1004261 RepID=A0A917Y0F9_9BACI|nr:hypothetical protein [Oceanobacillus indicireducens]GGN59455.1 hypothetical protein GCM10007971_22620 [Oceanobacillus indicireducens]